MPFTAVLSSAAHIFEMLVLSLTSHARLTLASEPSDYDLIIKRTIREVKFYSETLLSILFFTDNPYLISVTLACLFFTLITYISLQAMSGDSLHTWIDSIPYGRAVLAILTKLPALSVLWTLSALALSQMESLATEIVLALVAGVLVIGLAVRMRVHIGIAQAGCAMWRWIRAVACKVLGSKREEWSEGCNPKAKEANGQPIGDECV